MTTYKYFTSIYHDARKPLNNFTALVHDNQIKVFVVLLLYITDIEVSVVYVSSVKWAHYVGFE